MTWTAIALVSLVTVTAQAQRQPGGRSGGGGRSGNTLGTERRISPLGRAASAPRTSVAVDGIRQSKTLAVQWERTAQTASARGNFREAAAAQRQVATARTQEAQHFLDVAETLNGVGSGETGSGDVPAVRQLVERHVMFAAVAHSQAAHAYDQAANAHRSAGATDSASYARDDAGRAYRASGNAYVRIGDRRQAFQEFHASANSHADANNFGMAVYSLEAAGELMVDEDPRAAGGDFMRAAGLAVRAAAVAGNTSRPPVSMRAWHEEASRLYTAAARALERTGERGVSRQAVELAREQAAIAAR